MSFHRHFDDVSVFVSSLQSVSVCVDTRALCFLAMAGMWQPLVSVALKHRSCMERHVCAVICLEPQVVKRFCCFEGFSDRARVPPPATGF